MIETKNFTEQEIKILGYSQAGAALFSLLSSVAVTGFILTYKRYKRLTQRLIMYLNTAIFFNSTSFIIRGVGYQAMEHEITCALTGYYGQVTGGFILASIWCIIIEIVLNAWRQKGAGKFLETFYLVLIFVLPTLTALIPFIGKNYGQSTAWCWIRSDTKKGHIMQYVLWYAPVFGLILFGGIVYFVGIFVIGYKIKKHGRRYSSDGSREKQKQLLKELNQFRWYPVVFFIMNLVPLANRIVEYFKKELMFELWITAGVIQGLQGIVVAILFFASPSTRKHFKPKRPKCCKFGKAYDDTDESTPLSGSPQSSYEAVPSPYKSTPCTGNQTSPSHVNPNHSF